MSWSSEKYFARRLQLDCASSVGSGWQVMKSIQGVQKLYDLKMCKMDEIIFWK